LKVCIKKKICINREDNPFRAIFLFNFINLLVFQIEKADEKRLMKEDDP